MNSPEWQKCLERRKIKPFEQGKILFSKELNLAEEDLKSCQDAFAKENYK